MPRPPLLSLQECASPCSSIQSCLPLCSQYLVSLHPGVEARVEEELKGLGLCGPGAKELEVGDLGRLRWLNAVVKVGWGALGGTGNGRVKKGMRVAREMLTRRRLLKDASHPNWADSPDSFPVAGNSAHHARLRGRHGSRV